MSPNPACGEFCIITRRIASLRGRMRTIRFNTALGLLITGGLLMAAQFVLLNDPMSTRRGLAGTVLTSGANQGDTDDAPAAGCHEEPVRRDQAPRNHDCCTIGHLHAIASASVVTAPAFAVSPVNSPLVQPASIEQTASQSSQFSDTGPPGSAVPIRI